LDLWNSGDSAKSQGGTSAERGARAKNDLKLQEKKDKPLFTIWAKQRRGNEQLPVKKSTHRLCSRYIVGGTRLRASPLKAPNSLLKKRPPDNRLRREENSDDETAGGGKRSANSHARRKESDSKKETELSRPPGIPKERETQGREEGETSGGQTKRAK